MNIGFIGFGNMARALVKGLQSDSHHILRAAAPSLSQGVNQEGIQTYADNLAVIPNADILILAVKPAQMETVLTQLKSFTLPEHCLIISIVSGLNLTRFKHYLPNASIVRAMPNIGAENGNSATPLFANAQVTRHQRQCAEQIFTSIGLTTWAEKESDIDAFTALSGSGPAYVFLMIEAMIKSAVALGIKSDIAKSFALQTFKGALSLATQSTDSLAELRKKVTSPAGTTAAALEVFTRYHFDDIVHQAMLAALERAQELGKN